MLLYYRETGVMVTAAAAIFVVFDGDTRAGAGCGYVLLIFRVRKCVAQEMHGS